MLMPQIRTTRFGPLTPLVVAVALASILFFFGLDRKVEAQLTGPELPADLYNYEDVALPEHYLANGFPPEMARFIPTAIWTDNTPADNPVSDEGAALGRVLFYDRSLSANGTVACASCHIQERGFSDPAAVSTGFEGGTTRRNSMTVVNARFYRPGSFFWDQRAETLEDQVLMPFEDPIEMGLTLDGLVAIVEDQPYYRPLFADAFGDEGVTTDRISKALAQFVRSIVSFNSPYDAGRATVDSPLDPFPNFTDQENLGKDLFFVTETISQTCAGCHATEAMVMTASGPQNNGIDLASTTDCGLFETTQLASDVGKFKPATLRNIAVTAPYMHDGRFATLEEVVEHYSTGVQGAPNLSGPLRDGDALSNTQHLRRFTAEESAALVAFLKTLTDAELLADPRFSDPFPGSSPDARPTPKAVDLAPATGPGVPCPDAATISAAFAASQSQLKTSNTRAWVATGALLALVAAPGFVLAWRRRRKRRGLQTQSGPVAR